RKLLFQDCGIEKERQRGPLSRIGRDHQNFSIANEECCGRVSSKLFPNNQPAIVECEVQILTVKSRIADAIYPGKIEPRFPQAAIKGCSRTGSRILSEDWNRKSQKPHHCSQSAAQHARPCPSNCRIPGYQGQFLGWNTVTG